MSTMSSDGQGWWQGAEPVEGGVESALDPYVYLQLFERDRGAAEGRAGRPEYKERKPYCIRRGDITGVDLLVANSGPVPSDVVTVSYRLILCTYPQHGPKDGFSTSHAAEVNSGFGEHTLVIAVVGAESTSLVRIDFPDWVASHATNISNLYLRLRVQTLFEKKKHPDNWDPVSDPRVAEWHLRN